MSGTANTGITSARCVVDSSGLIRLCRCLGHLLADLASLAPRCPAILVMVRTGVGQERELAVTQAFDKHPFSGLSSITRGNWSMRFSSPIRTRRSAFPCRRRSPPGFVGAAPSGKGRHRGAGLRMLLRVIKQYATQCVGLAIIAVPARPAWVHSTRVRLCASGDSSNRARLLALPTRSAPRKCVQAWP